ncbi:NAD(P)/FAD-dependent oxidoreductase [uncultured Jatrophihabitans sp.]|uniref:NAD(P)/FAD-dependent oxidoreductase n=1 Tax=uncultured Jatrophihabitans sp. TaxID=1610747 RepID=UPI0035CB2BE9
MSSYRDLSLWFDQLSPATLQPRHPLARDVEADVAIVGAGFTGLWTAYYLHELDPTLRIVVLESQVAGFGASGRNGGWCSALFPVSAATLAQEAGHDAAVAQYRAQRGAVREVLRVAAEQDIDADIALGGTVVVARSTAQLDRARAEVAEADDFGLDISLLDADAAGARLAATDVLGATYTPHCAVLQPAKLVRGLADAVERRGVTIYERSTATRIEPHTVHTALARVRAGTVVRATEGYTARLPGSRRALVPVYSLIIATEPLPDTMWEQIGLRERETFADHRNLIIYGQRSADGRVVFGGRGAPYHWSSRIEPAYDREPRVFDALERTLHELFPVLRSARITHRWGGPLGIARDWHASVGHDSDTGLAWAGGYVGDGVATANLAGQTLADLITDRDTERTSLPWVGHRSRSWEPEPLRWLGANLGLRAMEWADHAEAAGRRPSRTVGAVNAMMGR